MGRILAIDYGTKRCGIAATDSMRIIASPLSTVHPSELLNFLKNYISKETVDAITIGQPKQKDGTASMVEQHIVGFIRKLAAEHPNIKIFRTDERFTSVLAQRSLIESGASKKDRQTKELTDQVSAAIILQSFLESRTYRESGI